MSEALHLLLIEDAPRDARALREMLADTTDAPPQIQHVTTLAAAVAALQQAPFDCVLLDLRLPDSEGVQGVERLRAVKPDITVVVLTGNSDHQSALGALQQGAQDYVIKGSLDGDALLRQLRHAVERNRLVSAIERARLAEYHRATHDTLTALPNRQLFNDRLRTALAQRRSGRLVVCFVDLDGFKAVNDQHGHATGDTLLKAVAATLQDSVRQGDTVARLGGDEFAVLLHDARDADEAGLVAQRIVERVATLSRMEGRTLIIGASVGLALHPLHGSDGDTLLASADRAMYQAKAAGKGQWRFGSPTPQDTLLLRGRSESTGFNLDNLRLCYQPWYDTASRRCLGVEALVRVDQGAEAEPALFRAQAQQALPQLGRWVLERACRDWLGLRTPPPCLAINITSTDLQTTGYAETTLAVLAALGMPPERVQLEIAEDELVSLAELRPLLVTLTALRAAGVRIALDRFGRHQAALGKLAGLPVDVIKLDGRHVQALRADPVARAFLTGVLGYAAALGCQTVLCGVESASDLANLGSLAPDCVQGFGLAPPQAADHPLSCRLPC